MCREPWPCAPAKVELLEEYGAERTSLLIYLSLQMIDAIDDMAANGRAPADLYLRFVGWVKGPSTFTS